jgi:hypothetical protein
VRLRLRMHRPQQSLRLLTRKGGRDHSAIDHRPLPRITFGGISSGRALCPQADPLAGRRRNELNQRRRSAPCTCMNELGRYTSARSIGGRN